MNYKLAFWIMTIVYGLDCILLTPYILLNRVGREAGLLCAWGYYNSGLGLSFFYIWFLVWGFILWFILKYSFRFLDYKLGKLAIYPKITIVLVWIVGMIWTITNNLGVLLN